MKLRVSEKLFEFYVAAKCSRLESLFLHPKLSLLVPQ